MVTTVGIFSNQNDARFALTELRSSGIGAAEISYVYVNVSGALAAQDPQQLEGGGASVKNVLSEALGADLGFVIQHGTLPKLGELLASGPLSDKLGFSGTAVPGGFVGACTGLGIHHADAQRFHEYLIGGDILIVVCQKVSTPKDVFTRAHAREIQEYAQ